MRDELVSHGLPPPRFDADSGSFLVTFHAKTSVSAGVQIAPEFLAQLEERQKTVVEMVRAHGRITRSDCMKKFGVSPRTATRNLNTLVELGIMEKKGPGPKTHYVLIGS